MTRKDYETIESLAARGVSEKSIARAVNVEYRHRWRALKEEDPRAAEALERGRAAEHDALVGVLYRAATEKGNTTAAMFLLKCRHGYVDQPRPSEAAENRVSITFQLPAPLTPDQYERLVSSVPPKALREAGLEGGNEAGGGGPRRLGGGAA
ncbi:MAG TPA: hypothetical protein VLF66_19240 [Thermoanaerobaculia bacterium]|nr:hypothetical protein [Thermoanaerobaculia bacterium]